MYGPRVWAEIRLGSIARNVTALRGFLGARTKIMGVVKADAYGHGAVPVGRALLDAGVDRLGVGDSSEAIELRRAGILAPISILGATVEREVDEVVFHGLTPMIHSEDRVHLFDARARRQGKQLPVHVMVDTGMGRLGVRPESVLGILQAIAGAPHLYLEGLASHFATAGEPGGDAFQSEQLARFNRTLSQVRARGWHVPLCHIANSAGLLSDRASHHDMVRPGIAMYGVHPYPQAHVEADGSPQVLTPKLEPVLAVKTQIAYLKEVEAGATVSYGRSWRASSRARVATLPIGYNDGYLPQLAGKAEVLIDGVRLPVVGRITMDYTMVDVTALPGVDVYAEVTLIGRSGAAEIRVEDVAAWAGVLPYAIPCGLGKRVERLYVADYAGSTARRAG